MSDKVPQAADIDVDRILALSDFCDDYDVAEHLEETRPAHFDVELERRVHLVAVPDDLFSKALAEAQRSGKPVREFVADAISAHVRAA